MLFSLFDSPNALKLTKSTGNRVKLAKSATNIAKTVSKPKCTVGIKLKAGSIENQKIIVSEV